MTTPPAGPGRVDGGHPGASGSVGSEDRTRPIQPGSVPPPSAVPPQGPGPQPGVPTQYLPPDQQQPPVYGGGYPPSGQYGQQQQPPGWPPQGGYGAQYPPYQPPASAPNRTGLIVGVVVLVLVLVAGTAGWYFVLGPGSKKDPASTGAPTASQPLAPGGAPSGGVPPAPDADKGGDVDVDVAIGDCVNVSGSDYSPDLEQAACGSTDANYKVIGKAPTQDQCASDADATYYESLGGTEVGALCLDIDWAKGDCFDLSASNPARIDCTTPGNKRVRVGDTVQGTTSVSKCPADGYTYDERKFVVCLSDI
jgi:hypothetical protein